METIKLYNYFRSSASYRVRIALHHKKIPFEYIPVHLLNNGGEQNSESYSSMNPMKQVPTLVHGEVSLTQSLPAISYLDDVFAENPLFPKNPAIKAQVMTFCEIVNSGIQPLQNLKTMTQLTDTFSATTEQKKEWISYWCTRGFYALEQIAKQTSGKFCFGDTITAADAFLIPQVFAAHRFEVSFKDFPTLDRINTNCLELEAFKLAHPLAQEDAPKD